MTTASLELVVARHREDLRWLRKVPAQVRVTVYDKGGEAAGAIPLPNVGREAHTYLHHIVSRYDDLAETTIFAQGKPFDHVSTFHHVLRDLAAGRSTSDEFIWLGFIIDWDDATGSRLFQAWSKNHERAPLAMDTFSRALWDRPADERYVFFPGGNFIAQRALIRRNPRSYYERALDVAARLADAAHCFERTWDRVFGIDGLPPEHRGKELPVYTKPIRRLIDAEQAVKPDNAGAPHPEPSGPTSS